jgi:hypothetical protein
MPTPYRRHVTARLAVAVVGLSVLIVPGGCVAVTAAVPGCGSVERLALVAQSVPRASYVPCLRVLSPGWKAAGFHATNGHTTFSLLSDRAAGRPVDIELASACDVAGATPTTPRAPGVRTYTRLRSISPRYSGTLLDAFTGGCVSYRFDFQRGPHIALIEEFESAVDLFPRQELSLELHKRIGVTVGP